MTYEECKDSDGYLHKEWMTEDGKLHREDGPAYIHHSPDGSIRTEYFYLNGRLHRESGPAYIHHNYNSSTKDEWFYFNGNYIGSGKRGFWKLWDCLTEEQRKNPELLKYLVRFS